MTDFILASLLFAATVILLALGLIILVIGFLKYHHMRGRG